MDISRAEKAVKDYLDKLILISEPLCPMWNRENFIFRKQAKWNYIDGCMINALLMLYKVTGDKRLTEYSEKFIGAYVREDGTIPTMHTEDFNLDNINGGKVLIKLWKLTGEPMYRRGFVRLYEEQLTKQPRLLCGSFWHKAIYPFQLWLDGSYMALPFMAEYAVMTEQSRIIEDVERQLGNIREKLRDVDTGLYYHGYDETRSMNWADKTTGCSREFWLRAIGWLCAGLADIAEILPDSDVCRGMLRDILLSLCRYTDDDGMLYQLPVKRELSGNYPETSGTLLFAYAMMKAERLGIVGDGSAGAKAFMTVTDRFITFTEDAPILGNICLMGGLGGDSGRDGSAEYYLGEKIVENDAKGIAPYLMAFTELKRRNGEINELSDQTNA